MAVSTSSSKGSRKTRARSSKGRSPARSGKLSAAAASAAAAAVKSSKAPADATRRAAPAKTSAKPAASRALRGLAAVVSKAMPGWRIVETPAQKAGKVEDGFVKIDQGPSIADLKRKFLRGDDAQDDAGNPFEADDGRIPVRIRPDTGGDAKTADIGPDGKVTIVQG